MKKSKIYLIDGSSYIFRAFYAVRPLTTSSGTPVNAVLGFTKMVLKLLEEKKPEYIAMVFDTAKPTFRKDIYPEYKANRETPPEELIVQFDIIHEAVEALSLPMVSQEGFEADDIIASLSKLANENGFPVEVITGDKDLIQLSSELTQVYDTMKECYLDEKYLKEKLGIHPKQMKDFLALTGDSSDNIPGVKGIGKKTAGELLNLFQDLDGIYQNINQIKQKRRQQLLEEGKDLAYLSQKLVELSYEAQTISSLDELEYNGWNNEKFVEFAKKYEFKQIVAKYGNDQNTTKKTNESQTSPVYIKGSTECIDTSAKLKKIIPFIQKAKLLSLDTETTGLDPMNCKIVGISLSLLEGKTYYLSLLHKDSQNLTHNDIKELLAPILENEEIKKVGQNLKYDYRVLKHTLGIHVKGIFSDSMLASYIADPEQKHGLDTLASQYLHHTTIKYTDLVEDPKKTTLDQLTSDQVTDYAGEDAHIALLLHKAMSEELNKEQQKLLFEVETPLLTILAEMESKGVLVDKNGLEKLSVTLDEELNSITEQIYKLGNKEFNINSTKQLAQILFEDLKLTPIKKTKTGYSTNEEVLYQLRDEHEIIAWILKYREVKKIQSTYVLGLLQQINPKTGRIHTQFNQSVTATGRLSSSHPNLQNIPISTESSYKIRHYFIADKKTCFVKADYSQIELRLLAHMSGDKTLTEAFLNNEDIHEVTAKKVFRTQNISPEQRRIAKTINFGIIYGQTPFGLSKQLGIPRKEAENFISSYFEEYPAVTTYMSQIKKQATTDGYVTTLLGRKRYVPSINSKNKFQREMAERTATNTPLQGTAADLIKIAMINVNKELKTKKMSSELILQVHDELILECPESEAKEASQILKTQMETALRIDVPLVAEPSTSRVWE